MTHDIEIELSEYFDEVEAPTRLIRCQEGATGYD